MPVLNTTVYNQLIKLTFVCWGGAGVIVTEGDRSLTPGGNPDIGRPAGGLWLACGTDRLAARLLSGVAVICGLCMLDLGGG